MQDGKLKNGKKQKTSVSGNKSPGKYTRYTVLPESNGPFGQRTALGWSIVGSDCSGVNNDCDPIGLSHRVFAREIQSSVSEPID